MSKAGTLYRSLAKLIDVSIVGILSSISPFFGTLAGALYFLISDGLFDGQSIGKKCLDLQVKVLSSKSKLEQCGFKESIIRNLPFSVFIVLNGIPFIGAIFLFLGLVFCALEFYFIVNDKKGIRVGDIYAETQVVAVVKENSKKEDKIVIAK